MKLWIPFWNHWVILFLKYFAQVIFQTNAKIISLYYVPGFIMKELSICQLMKNSITEPLREIISLESLILFTEMHAIITTSKLSDWEITVQSGMNYSF